MRYAYPGGSELVSATYKTVRVQTALEVIKFNSPD